MDTSIFDAFPNAIISGVWSIGTCRHGTLVGNQYAKVADIDVVIDEGSSSSINTAPETLDSDLLVYVMPEQMPTLRTNKLVSDYMLYDSSEDDYYMIVDAGVGKNQHTGAIEHLELKLVQTETVDG
jgi:hypothetical protein